MKTMAVLSLSEREFGKKLVGEVRRALSDGSRSGFYRVRVDAADPRFRTVMDLLHSRRIVPWRHHERERRREREFTLELMREYEAKDFGNCQYVQFEPHPESKLSVLGKDGLQELNEGILDPKRSFARSFGDFFVADRVKRLLESQCFVGLLFRPTRLRTRLREDIEVDELGDVVPWEQWGAPWWQMLPDRVMPSLSPSMTFIKSRLQEYYLVHPPLDDPNYCYTPYDGLYTPVELHYHQSNLEKGGPVDYARTLEALGASSHPIIVSKRFYDCCMAHGLESDWVPVRIDP